MAKKDYSQLSKEELIEEIKRLKEQKKFGLVWEDKPEDVAVQCESELPVLEEVSKRAINKNPNGTTNILIEGDNYHALSVLNYTHAGKVDVIYIDPPYNTGAKDWKYNNRFVDINDVYRHSKWLSMMHKRLKMAKGLLKEDGVLICAIDDNESNRLGLLLEDIFPECEIHCVTIVHNPRGIQGNNFSYTHEYAYFVFKKGLKVVGTRKLNDEEKSMSNLRKWGGESLRSDARNCFYPIIIQDDKIVDFGDVVPSSEHPRQQTRKVGNKYYVYPIDTQGVERKWRYARQSVDEIKDILHVRKTETGYEVEIGKDFGIVRTVWQDKRYDASVYGTQLVHALVPNTDFDFPKSIWNTYDCLLPLIRNRKDAIILDYFAGSGTTGHAVMILNKEDGGNRKIILCTNNENGIAEDVCYPRIKKVIDGHKNYLDITGIPANLRYFKTAFVSKSKVSDDVKYKLVERSTEMICIREDTFGEVLDRKYIKIFKNTDHYTAILFHLDYFSDFIKELHKLDKETHIYVFSLTTDTYDEDFREMKQKYVLCPIPESILQVYRKVFQEK